MTRAEQKTFESRISEGAKLICLEGFITYDIKHISKVSMTLIKAFLRLQVDMHFEDRSYVRRGAPVCEFCLSAAVIGRQSVSLQY